MADKKNRIGLLIHDSFSDYTKELIEGIRRYCAEKNYSLFIFSVGELGANYSAYDYQRRATSAFAEKNNLDGLIIASSTQGNLVSKDVLINYVKNNFDLPKVSIGLPIEGIPSLKVDCENGIRSVIKCFVEKHHCKKIGLIGVSGDSAEAKERTDAFCKILKEYNMPYNRSDFMYGSFTYETAMTKIKQHVQIHGGLLFDAVLCLNDDMAYALIDYCKEHNIRIPEDIKIAGFDDVKRSAYVSPTLSSVNQQIFRQGYISAKTLDNILNGIAVEQVTKIPTVAFFRQTTGDVELTDHDTNFVCEDGSKKDYSDTEAGSSIVEWIEKKQYLVKMSYLQSTLQANLNIEQLRETFNASIKQFDIEAAALIVYDKPVKVPEPFFSYKLPDKAFVLSSYDESSGYVQNNALDPIPFNPNEKMFPNDLFHNKEKRIFVHALSNCEYQYGFIFFSAGSCEELIYDLMCSTFSKLISTAFENSKKEKEQFELTEKNRELSEISTKDEMTGLLNRRGFMELGQESMNIAIKLNQGGLVIFGDMDGLKNINDTFGHDAGDRAIKGEAEILRKTFRASDIVGRLGGDEFSIIANGLTEPVFQRIRNTLNENCKKWNRENNEPFELSISLGAASFDAENHNLSEILHKADIILYEEKRGKKLSRRGKTN